MTEQEVLMQILHELHLQQLNGVILNCLIGGLVGSVIGLMILRR